MRAPVFSLGALVNSITPLASYSMSHHDSHKYIIDSGESIIMIECIQQSDKTHPTRSWVACFFSLGKFMCCVGLGDALDAFKNVSVVDVMNT